MGHEVALLRQPIPSAETLGQPTSAGVTYRAALRKSLRKNSSVHHGHLLSCRHRFSTSPNLFILSIPKQTGVNVWAKSLFEVQC